MAQAKRDENRVPTLIGVDHIAFTTPVTVAVNAAHEMLVSAAVTVTGVATEANQTNGTQKIQIVDAGGDAVTVTGGKLDVNATVDTTGLATSAKQDTGNTSLSSIDTKIPALGQALAASSVPIVLTAAQMTTLTPPAAITGFATAAAQTDKSQFTKLTDGTDTALITGSGELNVLETNSAAIKTAVETIDNAISGAGFNITQFAGTNAVVGSGNATGALRVELPTNGTGVIATVSALGISTTGPQKAEDVAHATGDMGIAAWGVSNENSTAFGAASGDYTPHAVNRYGQGYVTAPPPTHVSSNGTPITATTTTVIAAPSAGNHLRIVRIHLSNGGSTATWVAIRDGAAGTQHYRSYLMQGATISLNLNDSGPLDLTTATRMDIVLSAAGSVEYEVDYFTVAD